MSTTHVVSSRRNVDEPEGRILRYTLSERVHHWAGALFYIYCLITGLAFWSPYMYWLAALLGGGSASRFCLPWFGLSFSVSMFWMYRMWDRDMLTTDDDRRWSKAMEHYVKNEDEQLPPIGRFNYGQKLFFWLMFYGEILLMVSGIGLGFVDRLPLNPRCV